MNAPEGGRGSAPGPPCAGPGENAPEGERGSGGSGGNGAKEGPPLAPGMVLGALNADGAAGAIGVGEYGGRGSKAGVATADGIGAAATAARGCGDVGSRVNGLSTDGSGSDWCAAGAGEVVAGASTRADAAPEACATALPASWPQAKQLEPSQARPQLGHRCTLTAQA